MFTVLETHNHIIILYLVMMMVGVYFYQSIVHLFDTVEIRFKQIQRNLIIK